MVERAPAIKHDQRDLIHGAMRRGIDLWLTKCRSSCHTPAIVFGSTVNALSYVRSLSRKGVPVLVADVNRGVVSHSRFGTFVHLPIHQHDTRAGTSSANALLDSCQHAGVTPVVLATSDAWQVYLSDRQEQGECHFLTLTASKSAIDICVDKQGQYELAERTGVAVPTFANAGDVFDGRKAWESFPAIIKPRWAHLGRDVIGAKVLTVDTRDALVESLGRLAQSGEVGNYLVQEIVEGGDDCLYAYLGCYDHDETEYCYLIKRKLRQHPAQFGDGSYDTTCADNGVGDAARRLLKALGFRGVVGIEFKCNEVRDRWELIEINPRAVSTIQLAVTAGIDFPWHSYQLALHSAPDSRVGPDPPPSTYRTGVCHINGERDLRSFLARWKRGELGVIEWLSSVMHAESCAVWDKADIKPFVATTAAMLWQKLRRLRSTDSPQHNVHLESTTGAIAQATR